VTHFSQNFIGWPKIAEEPPIGEQFISRAGKDAFHRVGG
jgi:hypothetical protein